MMRKNDMDYCMERKAKLLEEADRLEKIQFKKQIPLLQEYYQRDEVRDKVKEAFTVLFEKWDREEPAGSLGIHYLWTNLHNRTYSYQLMLYGETFYLDEKAIEASWKPEFFFALLEEDAGEILKLIRKQFPRVCAYEEELIRHHCAGYYQAAIYQLCRDILPEIMESKAFERLPKTEEFIWFFGGYRGEGEVLAKVVCTKKRKESLTCIEIEKGHIFCPFSHL